MVKQLQIIVLQGRKPRDLHHFKSFMNFKARSKINLKFSEKSYPINGFRELFKYLLDVLDCVHKLLYLFFFRRERCNTEENFHKMGQQTFKKGKIKRHPFVLAYAM